MFNLIHSGMLRTALLVPATVLLMGTIGCGGASMLQRSSDSYGNGGDGQAVPTVTVTAGNGYEIAVSATVALDSATLYFTSGDNESHELNGLSDSFTSALDANLSYLKVQGKGGEYWFFDKAGGWLPDGYKPKFTFGAKGVSDITVVDTTLTVVASDTMCEVKVGYSDNTIQTFYTNSLEESLALAQSRPNVEAIMVKVLADGSKWYFDRDGNPLPLDSKWYQDLD